MIADYKCAVLVLLILLGACGNKGDLYLAPVELTDEQKALLGELDPADDTTVDEIDKKNKAQDSESAQ